MNSEFFDKGFAYIVENEWNSFYHTSFLSLLNTIFDFSAFHNILIDYLFTKQNIVGIIQNHINIAEKKYISTNTFVGYIPFFISLSYKINSICVAKSITSGNFEFLRDINNVDGDDNQNLNYEIFNPYSDAKFDQKYNKKVEEELQNGDPYESMKKYFDNEWSKYFNDNISDVIKQYKNLTWPSEEEEKMMEEKGEKKKDIDEAIFTIYGKDGDEKEKDSNITNKEKDGNEKKRDINEANITIYDKDGDEKKKDINEANIIIYDKDGNEKKKHHAKNISNKNKKGKKREKNYYNCAIF